MSKSIGTVRHYFVPGNERRVIVDDDLVTFFTFIEELYAKTDKGTSYCDFLANSMDDLLRKDQWEREMIFQYEDISITMVDVTDDGVTNER